MKSRAFVLALLVGGVLSSCDSPRNHPIYDSGAAAVPLDVDAKPTKPLDGGTDPKVDAPTTPSVDASVATPDSAGEVTPDASLVTPDALVSTPDAQPQNKDTGPLQGPTCAMEARCGANNTPETCSDGKWTTGKPCENSACVGGKCVGVCRPKAKGCGANETTQTCSDAGQWVDGAKCQNSVCNGGDCTGTCTPKAKRCENLQQEECNDQGRWTTVQSCSYVCVGVTCGGECAPKTEQCKSGQPQRCDDQGRWVTGTRDCTPPTATISPANGERGVRSDAEIVVTFSERMDTTNTREAIISADIPDFTYEWNASATVLRIHPSRPLEYATGTSKSIAARKYGITIGTQLKDAGGNTLASSISTSFYTLRRITTAIASDPSLTGIVRSDDVPVGVPYLLVTGPGGDGSVPSFITFSLTELPASVRDVQSAVLNILQQSTQTMNIRVYRAMFSSATQQIRQSRTALIAAEFPTGPAGTWQSLNVTSSVALDSQDVRSSSQFLMTTEDVNLSVLFHGPGTTNPESRPHLDITTLSE